LARAQAANLGTGWSTNSTLKTLSGFFQTPIRPGLEESKLLMVSVKVDRPNEFDSAMRHLRRLAEQA